MLQSTSNEDQILQATLLERRFQPADIPPSDGAGLYALFLTDVSLLPLLAVGPSSLLYVGMTASSLDVRNHFKHQHSGFSTVRRSLGALLKGELQLEAIPRAPGPSKTNTMNYRFAENGEKRLTDWMVHHLTYGYALVNRDLEAIERRFIIDLEPPLNLTGWRNPFRQKLKELRATCCDEARRTMAGSERRP